MPKRFVILSDKRTGSTWLQFALNSHPDILCLDEMFIYRGRGVGRGGYKFYRTLQKKKKWTIEKYLEWLYTLQENSAIGFRLMYNQEKHFNLLQRLKADKVSIIHLYRKNQFKRVFSRWTAGEKNPKSRVIIPNNLYDEIKASKERFRYYKKSKIGNYKKLFVLEMSSMFGKIEGVENTIRNQGAFNIRTDIKTYMEEILNEKICKFLDVEYHPLYSDISKKNKNPIWDYIENKDDVKQFFRERGALNWLEK